MRGTGKTTKQIEKLDEGGIFIVHDFFMAEYCRDIAFKMGKKIKVVVYNDDIIFQLKGRDNDVDIDHYLLETKRFSIELFDMVNFIKKERHERKQKK